MQDVTPGNFGFLVAYVLPGFAALWALGFVSPTVASLLRTSPEGVTVGGFLYITLASVGTGLVVSTIRWLVIDSLHHATGVTQPSWDFRKLEGKLAAFQLLVDSHYRYYQFYANSLVSIILVYGAWRAATSSDSVGPWDAAFAVVATTLFAGSRDTLRKYYGRGTAMLGRSN